MVCTSYAQPQLSSLKHKRHVAKSLAEEENEEIVQLALGDPVQADWVSDLVDKLEASVDDGAVLGWLQRTALLARVLLHRATITEAVRARLNELLTYSDVALFRAKNFMPTWKTVEEFAGAVREMAPELTAATSDAFDYVLDQIRGGPRELFESVEDQARHLLAELALDPVAGTNRSSG